MSQPRRTAPVGVAVGAIGSIQNAIVPAAAAAFSTGIAGPGLIIGLGVGLVVTLIGALFSYINWQRTTYTIGAEDIRVESGILSRAARSVPYERIQDVSLEAKLLPRLLGLVAVKFETGAGGGEDLSLEYLTTAEGERLRQLVRERREEDAAVLASTDDAAPAAPAPETDAQVIFAMTPGRILTFGLFEFSLAVFAVLGGLLQYADNVVDLDVWNVERWQDWLAEQGSVLASLGLYAQAASAIAGLLALIAVGMVTGIVRTALRDWGFTLSLSPRGFRRQRGLLTSTDVVMPAHRVQGLVIGTRLLRYRFGWHDLSFVSLAQDEGSESHVVAPFAQMEEILPIVTACGFAMPGADTQWQRASQRHCTDSAIAGSALFVAAAVLVAIFAEPAFSLIPLGLAVVVIGFNLYAWEFRRHALSPTQIFATTGFLSPTTRIAARLKLHSVEIAQGPVAWRRGYATVHLGLAGGTLAIPGVPLEAARSLRASILETIAETDFSRLDQARSGSQSGLSANLRAT